MPQYRVQVEAKNLLVDLNGRRAKHGFFAFRFVRAEHPNEARELAVRTIRDDAELATLVHNRPNDPPRFDAVEVVETEVFPHADSPPGRVWYEMNPKRWWQFWRR